MGPAQILWIAFMAWFVASIARNILAIGKPVGIVTPIRALWVFFIATAGIVFLIYLGHPAGVEAFLLWWGAVILDVLGGLGGVALVGRQLDNKVNSPSSTVWYIILSLVPIGAFLVCRPPNLF